MKTITIEVPRSGASIQLALRGSASSGQVVIVASDEVEIRYANSAPEATAAAAPGKAKTNANSPGKPPLDLDAISANLLKLGTKKRPAAVNAIRTMFQFTKPISAEAANKMLEDLRKRGDLSVALDGTIQFRNGGSSS